MVDINIYAGPRGKSATSIQVYGEKVPAHLPASRAVGREDEMGV